MIRKLVGLVVALVMVVGFCVAVYFYLVPRLQGWTEDVSERSKSESRGQQEESRAAVGD